MPQMSQSIEDYLEAIYNHLKEHSGMRITTLAKQMNVAKSSANQAVNRLKVMGFVTHEAYGMIYLTELGKQKGKDIVNRHSLLYRFLSEVLQVSDENAENDACKIEHIISTETAEKIKNYLENIDCS